MKEGDGTVNPGSNGRSEGGRFASGNTFARGNPINRRMMAMRAKLLDVVSDEDIERIGRSMVDQATAGDVASARVVLDYCLGKPLQSIDLSGTIDGSLEGPGLVALILTTLSPYPEAKAALANTLARLGGDGGRDV